MEKMLGHEEQLVHLPKASAVQSWLAMREVLNGVHFSSIRADPAGRAQYDPAGSDDPKAGTLDLAALDATYILPSIPRARA